MNFIILAVCGLLAFIVISALINRLIDNRTELDDEEEDRLTDLYRDR